MKKLLILLAVGAIPVLSFGQNQSLKDKAAEQKAIKTANEDYKKGQLKYYFHGIAAPSKSNMEALKRAKITGISKGCMSTTYDEAYNNEVNRLLKKDKNSDVTVLLSKKS